tara:strand:+ start:226 stop:492 length:267 start_codon:yes stop_codon:yes gene_type:complete
MSELKVEEGSPKTPEGQKYPNLIATNAVLQYLREIFMALDNMSFQIRTTMNGIINTDSPNMSIENPNEANTKDDAIIEGVKEEENANG